MRLLPTIVRGPAYEYVIALDDVNYRVVFRYITRTGNWHLDLFDSNGNPLHTNIKMVKNYPLLQRLASGERPPGDLFAVSPSSGVIGLTGLVDGQTRLYYFTEQEVAEVNAVIFAAAASANVTFTPSP